MKPVFGDTAYFLALVNSRDQLHAQAVALSRQPPGPLVTTEWVLMELGNALSVPTGRQKFSRLVDTLRAQPDVTIIGAGPAMFARACRWFDERQDKAWSLTDCTSFLIMEEQGLEMALTADLHFEQAGFRRLMRL